jgi:hypothetical protein
MAQQADKQNGKKWPDKRRARDFYDVQMCFSSFLKGIWTTALNNFCVRYCQTLFRKSFTHLKSRCSKFGIAQNLQEHLGLVRDAHFIGVFEQHTDEQHLPGVNHKILFQDPAKLTTGPQ